MSPVFLRVWKNYIEKRNTFSKHYLKTIHDHLSCTAKLVFLSIKTTFLLLTCKVCSIVLSINVENFTNLRGCNNIYITYSILYVLCSLNYGRRIFFFFIIDINRTAYALCLFFQRMANYHEKCTSCTLDVTL